MSKSTKSTVTARDLRDWFNADPKRIAALNDEKAAHTVTLVDGKAPRGRIHPAAVALHNKRRPKAQYVSGATKAAQAEAKAQALALRVAAFDKGLAVGQRGPLSKEAQAALGVAKPAKRTRKG